MAKRESRERTTGRPTNTWAGPPVYGDLSSFMMASGTKGTHYEGSTSTSSAGKLCSEDRGLGEGGQGETLFRARQDT